MASGGISWSALLLAVWVPAVPGIKAGQRLPEASNPVDLIDPTPPGIRTDRLSAKQLRVWKAIEAMVFAKDASGRLNHPKLHNLWRSVETSGNVIHVELPAPKALCDREAGKFLVEKRGLDGQKHIAVIQLCLPVIDEALVRERAGDSEGFVRFKGLGKKERYAEILGHELAHAGWTFADQNHARLLEELNAEVERFERSRRHALHRTALDEQEWQHLRKIESLMTEIESPAEIAEAEIWKELLEHRGK
jgi:hypothetical protein